MKNVMHSHPGTWYWSLLGLALVSELAACSSSHDQGRDTSPQKPAEPDVSLIESCPQYLCGQNDSRLNDYRFAMLHLGGKRNVHTGAALVGFEDRDGKRLALDVTPSGEMVGTYPGGVRLANEGLVGSHIIVDIRRKDGKSVTRVIEVKGVTRASHMSREDGALTRYWLSFGPPENPRQLSLCKGEDRADLGALLIRDELYSQKTLAIEAPIGDPRSRDWVTLLCHDHALEKMKRMSYDPGRSPKDPYFTTPAARNATIKMITAAYCENHDREWVSFTRPGTSLFWQNRAGWMIDGAPPDHSLMNYEIEAYWDENGAICLNTRRTEYARGYRVSRCWARLPACQGVPRRWEWVTYVPTGTVAR